MKKRNNLLALERDISDLYKKRFGSDCMCLSSNANLSQAKSWHWHTNPKKVCSYNPFLVAEFSVRHYPLMKLTECQGTPPKSVTFQISFSRFTSKSEIKYTAIFKTIGSFSPDHFDRNHRLKCVVGHGWILK